MTIHFFSDLRAAMLGFRLARILRKLTMIERPCTDCKKLHMLAITNQNPEFATSMHIACAHAIAMANSAATARLGQVTADMQAAQCTNPDCPEHGVAAQSATSSPARESDNSYG